MAHDPYERYENPLEVFVSIYSTS